MPSFLWQDRGVVPFLKVDKGLEAEPDGVQLMKPIPGLDALLARAVKLGVYGTKMRSVIHHASQDGIAAIARQQFEVGDADRRARADADPGAGSVHQEPGQGGGGAMLRDALARHLDALPAAREVMLKLTIPDPPDLYAPSDRARPGRAGSGAVGWLQAGRCLPAGLWRTTA